MKLAASPPWMTYGYFSPHSFARLEAVAIAEEGLVRGAVLAGFSGAALFFAGNVGGIRRDLDEARQSTAARTCGRRKECEDGKKDPIRKPIFVFKRTLRETLSDFGSTSPTLYRVTIS